MFQVRHYEIDKLRYKSCSVAHIHAIYFDFATTKEKLFIRIYIYIFVCVYKNYFYYYYMIINNVELYSKYLTIYSSKYLIKRIEKQFFYSNSLYLNMS
jgi:hypothetical protein